MYLDALAAAVEAASDMELVAAVTDGRAALEQVRESRPDIAVLDVRMPILSGPVVARHIAAEGLPTRVLFLSAQNDGPDVYDALASGGYGYVTKDATLQDIHTAIRRVAAGGRCLGSDAEQQVIAEIQQRAATSTAVALTERERAVLELAATGMTVAAMARHLSLSPGTVKVRLSTLYAKLGVADRASAVAQAIRLGLVS
jgi:two-component system nitrate/nitrite response regulator NarL